MDQAEKAVETVTVSTTEESDQQSQAMKKRPFTGHPHAQGLYDPRYEKDACGMGFVVDIHGRQSHETIHQALTVLKSLNHRGAAGSEKNTGDGAGITIQIPHQFFNQIAKQHGFVLPDAGQYGVGVAFLAHDDAKRDAAEAAIEAIVAQEGQTFLGWRTVPTNNSSLGETAKRGEPAIRHFFVAAGQTDLPSLEHVLYVIRKRIENEISERVYLPSLSSRTIVYKGMLLADQIPEYYLDLSNPEMTTAIAMVHSRFSTNTFPSWERAHPYRYVIHNGEINTVGGNKNWMKARQGVFKSAVFGDTLQKLMPVVAPGGSDTAAFDNALEFLTLNGRSLPHAVMMMIPEPWAKHTEMSAAKRAFYEYHSLLMEPWDGPASIGFTDGTRVGAVLDRNGLRPSRYYVTKDDRVIMASEVGVLDVPPEDIAAKGRLQPGKMFLIDTEQGRIISDEELKESFATAQPYEAWLTEHLLHVDQLPEPPTPSTLATEYEREAGTMPIDAPSPFPLVQQQQAFGYTYEDLRIMLAPMAAQGKDPIGSMGDDTPLAVLSDKPQSLYTYFRQLFAQVTNPPLDAIREELVTSTDTYLGAEQDILQETAVHARRLKLNSPILTDEQLAKLRHLEASGFKAVTLSILYDVQTGEAGLKGALDGLFAQADAAIANGANLLILSDRRINAKTAAIPALLATAGLHHHLVRNSSRTRVSLLVESGEPREVHHMAVLLGYGADAINPYLAYETIVDLLRRDFVTGISEQEALKRYFKALTKGIIKVMSKMGISTVQSYRGAQIFEAIGLQTSVVKQYFTGTASRIEGVGMETIAKEVAMRHTYAFPERQVNGKTLPVGGKYQFRENGEHHLFNPRTIHAMQTAVRTGNYEKFKEYSSDVNDQTKRLATLRGLMSFKFGERTSVPLDEVESVEEICRRFKTGAMSYGSISKEAHEALAIAMNRIGGRSNTGEGGEDPDRFIPEPNGDSRNSAIKQVASGRFGVTSEYLTQAKEIQIKMAQGAKPGEGGQLPGKKVYPWIAKVRFSTPGVGLISPPPHHDIYSIEDLAQLIHDLKNANPQARINVKLVSEVGVGTVAAGVAKGHADVILVSGHDGGTGASPQTSIKNAGMPWELGVAETQQTLLLNGLRSRITLETDGQMKTGRDVVIAALLGAEEFGFATSPLVALGCIMMRVCHLNTCPVGVATQNPALRKMFMGKPEHVVNFMQFIAQEAREIMAELGFRTFDELIGRSDVLEMREAIIHWKSKGIDLSNILYTPDVDGLGNPIGPDDRRKTMAQDHGLEQALDKRVLLDLCQPALEGEGPVWATLPITNTDRVVGTMLGSELTRRHGSGGLPQDTIRLRFKGSAGQSFGAFIPNGMTMVLEGDSNDYIGKGLSGGRIIVQKPETATFAAEENIIIGNVAFYGATDGEAYINGVAGERFCVRNSGVTAVVEGVGDHGCEYMTGGRVVVLGETGRNFAAGMSGGVAYVLDEHGNFANRCNTEMVGLELLLDEAEAEEVRELIRCHAYYTGSQVAQRVVNNWETLREKMVKVMPTDFKAMQQAFADAEAAGLTGDAAVLAAFEAKTSGKKLVTG